MQSYYHLVKSQVRRPLSVQILQHPSSSWRTVYDGPYSHPSQRPYDREVQEHHTKVPERVQCIWYSGGYHNPRQINERRQPDL